MTPTERTMPVIEVEWRPASALTGEPTADGGIYVVHLPAGDKGVLTERAVERLVEREAPSSAIRFLDRFDPTPRPAQQSALAAERIEAPASPGQGASPSRPTSRSGAGSVHVTRDVTFGGGAGPSGRSEHQVAPTG